MLQTNIITKEFEKHLEENEFFGDSNSLELNFDDWKLKFKNAISEDFNHTFPSLKIEIVKSEIDLNADQGAVVLIQKAKLFDSEKSEEIKIIIKTLITYSKTILYLDNECTNEKSIEVNSVLLKNIFRILKQADDIDGYFKPISLETFLNS
jgi:hypothetical protein